RRHTRCDRDWSSDVCSSDLAAFPPNVRSSAQTVLRVAAPVDNRRTVWADDRTFGGNAARVRNGRPRGANGFDGVDSGGERYGEGARKSVVEGEGRGLDGDDA